MKRIFAAGMLLALFVATSFAAARPASPTEQTFFEGSWRCQQGMNLNVARGFGPWYVWRSTASSESRAFIRKTDAGNWINVGVDSNGGWWSSTAPGWRGSALTFTGTYAYMGSNQSLKQTFTYNSKTAMTVQTWRNGSLVGQVGCNR